MKLIVKDFAAYRKYCRAYRVPKKNRRYLGLAPGGQLVFEERRMGERWYYSGDARSGREALVLRLPSSAPAAGEADLLRALARHTRYLGLADPSPEHLEREVSAWFDCLGYEDKEGRRIARKALESLAGMPKQWVPLTEGKEDYLLLLLLVEHLVGYRSVTVVCADAETVRSLARRMKSVRQLALESGLIQGKVRMETVTSFYCAAGQSLYERGPACLHCRFLTNCYALEQEKRLRTGKAGVRLITAEAYVMAVRGRSFGRSPLDLSGCQVVWNCQAALEKAYETAYSEQLSRNEAWLWVSKQNPCREKERVLLLLASCDTLEKWQKHARVLRGELRRLLEVSGENGVLADSEGKRLGRALEALKTPSAYALQVSGEKARLVPTKFSAWFRETLGGPHNFWVKQDNL